MGLLSRLLRRTPKGFPQQPWVRIPPGPVFPQRRFLEESAYLLPKDAEEENRLNFQHYALNLTLGNHYLAPLPPGVRVIVDSGTGTGIWCAEMARAFPQSLVLGFDIDPALFGTRLPDNCLLRAGNILTGLPLPEQFADFTHQRLLVLAIPDERWPDVVRELVRVTRVGGWLELVETDARLQAGGPATEQMMTWLDELRAARGLRGEAVLHLGELLRQEGVSEIETQAIPLKVGAWGGRAGQMMAQDILAAAQSLKEPCCARGIDPQTFENCAQAMAGEWQQMQAFCTVYVAYGRRA